MTTRRIGDVTITRIEEQMGPGFAAEMLLPDWDPEILKEPGAWLSPHYYEADTGRFITSIHSWLIKTPHHTILVDTCCGNAKNRPGFPRFHMLDTPWLDRLRAAGAAPEDIDYILCTHLHVDHVGWNTRLLDGRWVPTFPNAKYVMSRVDAEYFDPTRNPTLPEGSIAVFNDSVLPVIESGQATLVEMNDAIGDLITISPAPGHSPGHIVLTLKSQGETAMFIGDVMHQPIQVYRPEWSSRFCFDPKQAAISRVAVLETCAELGCRMLPTHFGTPHLGWVRRQPSGFRFEFDHGDAT
jgi:glyoxylase-like metal-dependent hydrolase (beta-lactamase superfamily II)